MVNFFYFTEIRLTWYKTGDYEREDEHFEHPHEDLSGEGDEMYDVITGLSRSGGKPDDRPQDHPYHCQRQQQIVKEPLLELLKKSFLTILGNSMLL